MTAYLETNPPARSQFRRVRRTPAFALGPRITAIVVHTSEGVLDSTPPDNGAEALAQFISTRTDAAGSYHSAVDSDTTMHIGEYWWEMFGEGTGGNRHALHLAFAMKAKDWPIVPESRTLDLYDQLWPWQAAALRRAADEANRMREYVLRTPGHTIPARQLTRAEYNRGEPGFISHAAIDPDRRTDPGPNFPWNVFLELVGRRSWSLEPTTTPTPTPTIIKPVPTPLSDLTLELASLYEVWTGNGENPDVTTWARHLSPLVYAGDDMTPHIQYIEWQLREQANR